MNPSRWLGWLLLLALLLALSSQGWAASPTVRLAILDGGERAALVDLLSAELSQWEGVVLVEREEWARVVREQALTLAQGNGEGAAALRLGRLLRADGVAILIPGQAVGRGKQKDPGRLRLLAVGPGAGVADLPLPAAGVDAAIWSRLTAGRLERALPKLTVRAGDAVAISLLNLRAAVRPAATSPGVEPLERELTLGLAERLRRAPEVFVLERQRLDALEREKEMAPNVGPDEEASFWNGGFLLDGTLDRDNLDPARVTVDARLRTRDASRPPITLHVEGAREGGPALVEELTGKILAAIGRPTTPHLAWDPLAEATEFEVEGHWAARWNQWPEAEAALDAAWALGDRHRALAVARILTCVRRTHDDTPWPPLDPARRALNLYLEGTGTWGLPVYRLDPDWYALGCRVLSMASGRLRGTQSDPAFRRDHYEELAGLRREIREVAARLQTANLADRPESSDPEPTTARVSDPFPGADDGTVPSVDMLQALYAPFWHDGPEGAIAVYRALFTGERCAPPADASRVRRGLPLENYRHGFLMLGGDGLPDWQVLGAGPLRTRWDGFIAELCTSPYPSAPFYGRLLALRQIEDPGEQTAAAERLLDALWQARTRVVSGEVDFDCLFLALKAIRLGAHSTPAFLRGPLKAARFQWLAALTVDNQVAAAETEESFLELLPSTFETNNYYDPAEIERVRAFALGFKGTPRPWLLTHYLNNLPREPVATAPDSLPLRAAAPTPTPPPAPTPDPRCLRVTRRFHPVPGGRIVGLRADDRGRVWADVRGGRVPAAIPGTGSGTLVEMDPATGREEVIRRPADNFSEEFNEERGGFEVVTGTPFISVREGVFRYTRAADGGRWEKLPLPGSYARLARVGDRLLISTYDAILRHDPATGQTEVLASARRRPVLNVLDSLDSFNFPVVRATPGGGLETVVLGRRYLFEPAAGQWRDDGPPPNPVEGVYPGHASRGDVYSLPPGRPDPNRMPWVLGPSKRWTNSWEDGLSGGDPSTNRFHAALRFEAPLPGLNSNRDYLWVRPRDVWLWFGLPDPVNRQDPNYRFPPFSLTHSTPLLASTAAGLGISELGREEYWFIPQEDLASGTNPRPPRSSGAP